METIAKTIGITAGKAYKVEHLHVNYPNVSGIVITDKGNLHALDLSGRDAIVDVFPDKPVEGEGPKMSYDEFLAQKKEAAEEPKPKKKSSSKA